MKTLEDSLTLDRLAGMEIFLGLSRAALADVAGCAHTRSLKKDTVVFTQDEPARHCHALVEGRVRITQADGNGAQLLVRFIGPGEMFGTVALFMDGRYPAEAAAVVDSIEVSWTEAALRDLMVRHPQVSLNIIRILGTRIREVQERLREVATQRVECRIAHALLRLADRAGQHAGKGVLIDFPLTRKDVADMCGATLHTVSRVLTAWEKAKLVATDRQRITLREPQAIRDIAEDLPGGSCCQLDPG
jgi:CRP-like cAMP-binding protein